MIQKPESQAALTRRHLLAGATAASALLTMPSHLRADELRLLKHGAFDITVMSDGFITLPSQVLLPDAEPAQRPPILQRLGGNADGAPVDANIPLIRHGSDLILIDNGSGTNFQTSAGQLERNLIAAGVRPEQITKVVFTHVHPDHSGSTTRADGSLVYPNADYYVGAGEWDFWTDREYETHMPAALHGFARGAQRDLFAVEDRIKIIRPGDEVVPGMRLVATPGHTPGHVSVELEGDGNLLITGDACTSDVIFFEHPDWHFGFDTEADVALKSRRSLLERAASEKIKMLGYHWKYPGIGYAERNGSAYRFVAG